LEEGYQAVQSLHAGIQFVFEHPEYAEHWYKQSNYLGLLSVADEQELTKLIEQAAANDIHFSIFREPDIEDQITAIALSPGPKSKKLCSKLQLALRNIK
jgi:peptidyl-tRNA hydrolase